MGQPCSAYLSNLEPTLRTSTLTALAGACTAAALLIACGGGESSPVPPVATVSAEGIYVGTITSGSTSRNYQTLVLENGDIWALYGTSASNGTFTVAGFIQGASSVTTNQLSAPSVKDFGVDPAQTNRLVATVDATAKTLNGTLTTASNASVTFTGGPNPSSTYNYATAASVASIAGNWSLGALTGEQIALAVASNGSFTARTNTGCSFSGSITPRPSGKNVFNMALTFGPTPCSLAGQAATGIALSYPLANGSTQLIVTGYDSTRSHGTASFGIR